MESHGRLMGPPRSAKLGSGGDGAVPGPESARVCERFVASAIGRCAAYGAAAYVIAVRGGIACRSSGVRVSAFIAIACLCPELESFLE